MAKFEVKIVMIVEADNEQDAFYVSESAVENLVCGDIVDASVDSVDSVTE
jgi:hypothetical protein